MTRLEVKKLEERVDELAGKSTEGPVLTTPEADMVRSFWRRLHWTDKEAEEYSAGKKRMDRIHIAAGGPYLGSEENREYMRLSKRSTELQHDIVAKRLQANVAMYDRIRVELVPRVLRFNKLAEKPREELTDIETEELGDLVNWFSKLQAEALEAAENQLTKAKVG